jgi:hypothetical protein
VFLVTTLLSVTSSGNDALLCFFRFFLGSFSCNGRIGYILIKPSSLNRELFRGKLKEKKRKEVFGETLYNKSRL